MGTLTDSRYIGLNRHGDEVYEANGARILRREGVEYSERGNENLPAHMFLRIKADNDLKWCAKGLGNTIMSHPTFRREAVEQFCRDIFPLIQPDQIRELLVLAQQYLAWHMKWDGDWQFLSSIVVPETSASIGLYEPDPILFVGIEGVITSLKTRMFHRAFDHDAISLIARLARKTGAKLILTSLAQTWPTGAEALHQTLIAEGWLSDLWHREWMLPLGDANMPWRELDAWLARRNCDDLSALIIGPDGNRYPGELPGDVGDFYTFPADGFTQWDYFEILSMLGLSDDDAVPPPTRPASGFRAAPGRWHGREIAQPTSPRVTHTQPTFPRPA